MENSGYTTSGNTDISSSKIDKSKDNTLDIQALVTNEAKKCKSPVLTMSSLGKLGRFGNQIFQYAFLKICAQQSGAIVECPSWIGQVLFGHSDAPISKPLSPAVERWEFGKNMFDLIPEFIPYIETVTGASSRRVGPEALGEEIVNVDLWGFFQLHTRFLKPHKEFFRSLFQPVYDLKSPLENGLNLLRSKGKTIIGIHLRRGDFTTEPLARYTLVVPSKWWCDWLDSIWSELENPVLFLCSDDIDSIIHDFDKFSPVTAKNLNIKFPDRMKDLNLEFYIDFFMLSHCDLVGISNSSFSFAACLLNEQAKLFVRPTRDFSTKFTVFDRWDSEPLLHLGCDRTKFLKGFGDALYVTYITQGIWIMLLCAFIYIPNSWIKIWMSRANLGYKISGITGLIKSILYTVGWRPAWK